MMQIVKFNDLINEPGRDRTEAIFAKSGALSFAPAVTPEGRNPGQERSLSLYLRKGKHTLHPLLGKTTHIWGYTACEHSEGQWPGPTIAVETGMRVKVKYYNRLSGTMGDVYKHFECKHIKGLKQPMNEPGAYHREHADPGQDVSASPDGNVLSLTPWTAPHLHGAPTIPDSDGWTDNVAGPDERRPREYTYDFPREQYRLPNPNAVGKPADRVIQGGAAPLFWYHDHAMGITRLNVFAGLAGAWVVRNSVENACHLPMGDFELPLILQDRNLETFDNRPDGALTGNVIHKVQDDVMEFFGPVNVVNGRMWPNIEVHPRVYRLRIANGCNARAYDLRFMVRKTDQEPWMPISPKFVQQIGTDGGLLGCAVGLSQLILASGERADVLVDFGEIAKGGCDAVTVFNVAPAPWGGTILEQNNLDLQEVLKKGNEKFFLTIPEMLRFRIGPGVPQTGLGPMHAPIDGMKLDPNFHRLDHGQLPSGKGHDHQLIVLREENELALDENQNPVPNDNSAPGVKTRKVLHMHEMMEEREATLMGMNMYEIRARGPVLIDKNIPDVFMASDPDPSDPSKGVRLGIKVDIPAGLGLTPGCYVTVAKKFSDGPTIVIAKDNWVIWKVLNLSPDSHPFHLHLVQCQALDRKVLTPPQAVDTLADAFDLTSWTVTDQPLGNNEKGWKDTIRADPGDRDEVNGNINNAQILSLTAQFCAHAGRYMYHCHIIEHEDHDMMRPYIVAPEAMLKLMNHGHGGATPPNGGHGGHGGHAV